jgi:hypothetical protein
MTERASDIAKRAAAVRTLAKSDSVVEAKNEAERIEALATTLDEKLIVIKLHHHLGVHHRALKMMMRSWRNNQSFFTSGGTRSPTISARGTWLALGDTSMSQPRPRR